MGRSILWLLRSADAGSYYRFTKLLLCYKTCRFISYEGQAEECFMHDVREVCR